MVGNIKSFLDVSLHQLHFVYLPIIHLYNLGYKHLHFNDIHMTATWVVECQVIPEKDMFESTCFRFTGVCIVTERSGLIVALCFENYMISPSCMVGYVHDFSIYINVFVPWPRNICKLRKINTSSPTSGLHWAGNVGQSRVKFPFRHQGWWSINPLYGQFGLVELMIHEEAHYSFR